MKNGALSEEFQEARKRDLEKRVSEKRMRHIEGVAQTAVNLAKTYGADEQKAYLAGLLHDWDKGYDNDGIRNRISELHMEEEMDPWVVEHMPQVLHGPTAARALEREFPEIPEDVIEAIRKHTTADVEMSDLDKIIYVADAIEPSREFDIVDELREQVGKVPLDELFFQVYKFWTIVLFEHDIVLHPETIRIWNTLASSRPKKHKGKKRKKKREQL